jgi:3-phosphoshikimate 1-carboxyvinyltransferase
LKIRKLYEVTDITLSLPSSKSLANRVLVLAAQSKGEFSLLGDFQAEDVQLMISALRELGLSINDTSQGLLITNDLSWKDSDEDLELYLGNSGTCVRFLSSLVPLRKGLTVLTGKQRMKERPIGDMTRALIQLGVEVQFLDNYGYPPVEYSFQNQSQSDVSISGKTSSQYLSSLLLSASSYPMGMNIRINGDLISKPYIVLTLDLLEKLGIHVEELEDGYRISPQALEAHDYIVEGDASAAVYWWAFGYLHDVDVNFENLEQNSVQGDMKFVDVLESLNIHSEGFFELDMNDLPDASMMLMALAPTLDFPVKITNIASLRVKETDRIQAMATELKKLGVQVEASEDSIFIDPSSFKDHPDEIEIETYDDHRIAMCFAILGTKIGNIVIKDPDCVNKTYPNFWQDLDCVS